MTSRSGFGAGAGVEIPHQFRELPTHRLQIAILACRVGVVGPAVDVDRHYDPVFAGGVALTDQCCRIAELLGNPELASIVKLDDGAVKGAALLIDGNLLQVVLGRGVVCLGAHAPARNQSQ